VTTTTMSAADDEDALAAVMAQMAVLHAALQVLQGELGTLKKLTVALDAIIANMDELGKLFEAPESTRTALDADSAVAALIDDLASGLYPRSRTALGLHTPGLLDLRAIAHVRENARVAA
jgi:hypothetical protein